MPNDGAGAHDPGPRRDCVSIDQTRLADGAGIACGEIGDETGVTGSEQPRAVAIADRIAQLFEGHAETASSPWPRRASEPFVARLMRVKEIS